MSTLLDIVKQLQKSGNKITFRQRSDGGIIITAINGVKYTGATGNTYARSMAGLTLSPARQQQLSFNVNKYIKGQRKPKVSSFNNDEELLRELRRVQRAFRKVKGKGRITKRKLRYYYQHEGRAGAMEYLKRRLSYAQGIAYPENVQWLVERMRRKAWQVESAELEALADTFERNKSTFREEWIEDCYNILYQIPSSISAQEGVQRLKQITNL